MEAKAIVSDRKQAVRDEMLRESDDMLLEIVDDPPQALVALAAAALADASHFISRLSFENPLSLELVNARIGIELAQAQLRKFQRGTL